MRIYGYVVMPEHVHLLVSEPDYKTLADAMHYLKLSFAKRLKTHSLKSHPTVPKPTVPGFGAVRWPLTWALRKLDPKRTASSSGTRYYDRNVRDEKEFVVKLRYLHRNPVKRGLVEHRSDWKWSSFRHYALREIGPVEIESEWIAIDRETKSSGGRPRIFLSPG